MSERWKMNRIGFVNFWLYDEEDFWFEDGKLLLRGQNGSGKSITTQSFIPFILDGDRTPSRLDPFGSNDRRMEFYFLGDGEKEESTGYLYLELKREGTGEFRTIGIGQRAKKGRPMEFWGFLILDGRRIGYDMRLYRETGSIKIPFDKRDMKKELGEENLFTDSPGEYKKLVNQYIFGFRKAEQYEQFIRLLVKVRAPKLSKEFKPTKVYEILNDSLQTLTDEDLRAMVDAMEKMDEIQESLDTLKRAFEDVKVIRTEYTRYNQFMLGRKAKLYLDRKQEVERAQGELEEQERQEKEHAATLKSSRQELLRLEEERRLKETERDGLQDPDLENMEQKLAAARAEQQEAQEHAAGKKEKAEEYNSKILQCERQLQTIRDGLEGNRGTLKERIRELRNVQDMLKWEQHEETIRLLGLERTEGLGGITGALEDYRKALKVCREKIRLYEEILKQYDEIAADLEDLKREQVRQMDVKEQAEREALDARDQWIAGLFELSKSAEEWTINRETLLEAERLLRAYTSAADAGKVRELLWQDYEARRRHLCEQRLETQRERDAKKEELAGAQAERKMVQETEDLGPERDEQVKRSREALARTGIRTVPFYRAVEFAEGLTPEAQARLEAQLQKMGLLDALVVDEKDIFRIEQECPEFLDTVIRVRGEDGEAFPDLTVNEELEPGLQESVSRILRSFCGSTDTEGTVCLEGSGAFRQGILEGRAQGEGDAEYVGDLARRKRREKKLQELADQIRKLSEEHDALEKELSRTASRLEKLETEYERIPDFAELNEALEKLRQCAADLERLDEQCAKQEQKERLCRLERDRRYQEMLKSCKPFPYGRTEAEYDEAIEAAEDYGRALQECRGILTQIEHGRENQRVQQDKTREYEGLMDDALREERQFSERARKCGIQIRQYEDYLNRPEIVEKAKRLEALYKELDTLAQEWQKTNNALIETGVLLDKVREHLPEKKRTLEKLIGEETYLRNYFEEELDLKLVFARETQNLPGCAQKALGYLREADRNREPSEMLQSLYNLFQRRNSSLVNYGTAMEECFGAPDTPAGGLNLTGALRSRQRIVSTWKGKRVCLEEFYEILKSAIDETELLIQRRDRELFEDILSQTISQQLTDRIADSRKWVEDMSALMKAMDTSMGLRFSLYWKPVSAQNEAELEVTELEKILRRDRALLTVEDIEKVALHFRSKIRTEKLRLEEEGGAVNYMELVRDALDYRKWFKFQMNYRRGEDKVKPLTNAAFNRFSGGEKAMAMYVPLFAAVNAQYQKAANPDHPRMIALDEAFAGVDDRNISSMFALIDKLDFDYIMNSQSLWGCYDTVRGLRIAELQKPENAPVVAIIRYTWNGHERILDEQ